MYTSSRLINIYTSMRNTGKSWGKVEEFNKDCVGRRVTTVLCCVTTVLCRVSVSSIFSVPGVRLAPEMDELLRTHLHTSSVHGEVMSKRWTQDTAFPLSLPSNHTAFNGRPVCDFSKHCDLSSDIFSLFLVSVSFQSNYYQ